MHMADALLAPTVAGVMYACSAGAAVCSIRKIKEESRDKLNCYPSSRHSKKHK